MTLENYAIRMTCQSLDQARKWRRWAGENGVNVRRRGLVITFDSYNRNMPLALEMMVREYGGTMEMSDVVEA